MRYRWQWGLLGPLLAFAAFQLLQFLNPYTANELITFKNATDLSAAFRIGSIDPYMTQTMLIKTLMYTGFVWLVTQYCTGQRALKILLFAIVLSACLQAFYGTVLNLLNFSHSPVFGYPEGNRARGSFVYQNHFANFLALSLSLAIGWLISELKTSKSRFKFKTFISDAMQTLLSSKMLLRLAIIIMIIGLILSRSRMGNAGFFSALMVTGVLALFIYKRPPTMLKPLLISIFVLDMIIVGSIFGLEKLQQRIEDTSFASETRDEVVIDSMPLIQKNWLTGTGAGTFYTAFPQIQPAPYTSYYDHAHNEYIQFMVELGVPVTLFLGVWVLYCLWLSIRTMQKRNSKLLKGVAFGCCMAILHMLIHNTVDFNLQAPANTMLFLLILSLCFIVKNMPEQNRYKKFAS
ncbi:polymerase [Pseudoalteromonas sp. A25]|nr:polymerase [Pseudoalteromonas sp. A25]